MPFKRLVVANSYCAGRAVPSCRSAGTGALSIHRSSLFDMFSFIAVVADTVWPVSSLACMHSHWSQLTVSNRLWTQRKLSNILCSKLWEGLLWLIRCKCLCPVFFTTVAHACLGRKVVPAVFWVIRLVPNQEPYWQFVVCICRLITCRVLCFRGIQSVSLNR